MCRKGSRRVNLYESGIGRRNRKHFRPTAAELGYAVTYPAYLFLILSLRDPVCSLPRGFTPCPPWTLHAVTVQLDCARGEVPVLLHAWRERTVERLGVVVAKQRLAVVLLAEVLCRSLLSPRGEGEVVRIENLAGQRTGHQKQIAASRYDAQPFHSQEW